MSKRTRYKERFPIGEWTHKVKLKHVEAMEVSKSLQNINQEISNAKETIKVLKENNINLQGEIKELRKKVSH